MTTGEGTVTPPTNFKTASLSYKPLFFLLLSKQFVPFPLQATPKPIITSLSNIYTRYIFIIITVFMYAAMRPTPLHHQVHYLTNKNPVYHDSVTECVVF